MILDSTMVAYTSGIWQFSALSFAYDNAQKFTTVIIYANRDVTGTDTFDTLFSDDSAYPHILGGEYDTAGDK